MPASTHNRAMGLVVVALGIVALAQGAEPAPVEPPPAPVRPAAPESPAARALREGRPMELNGATVADLELLPRIGPTLARRIVDYRTEHGSFESLPGLASVRGIGPRTLERLRALLVVGANGTPASTRADAGLGQPVDLRRDAAPGM